MITLGLAYAVTAVFVEVFAQVFMKLGMTRVGAIGRARLREPGVLAASVVSQWRLWLGLAAHAVSGVLWILALAVGPVSAAYVCLGIGYLVVAGFSVVVLDEWLTPAQWVGVLLLAFGVVTLALTA